MKCTWPRVFLLYKIECYIDAHTHAHTQARTHACTHTYIPTHTHIVKFLVQLLYTVVTAFRMYEFLIVVATILNYIISLLSFYVDVLSTEVSATSIVPIIVGSVFGGLFLLICLPIVCVCFVVCCVFCYSKSRSKNHTPVRAHASTGPAATVTVTTVDANTQQYPTQPNYSQQQQTGYTAPPDYPQQAGYTSAQTGYQPQPDYNQQTGYPAQTGYPPQASYPPQ